MGQQKVVLAYSGGLDTSVILKWLIDEFGYEVICFAADVGQAEELDGLEEKAMKTGAKKIYIEDLREEFVRDYVFPAFRANVVYEGSTFWAPRLPGRSSPSAWWRSPGRRPMQWPTVPRARATTRSGLRWPPGALPGIKIIAPWKMDEWKLRPGTR